MHLMTSYGCQGDVADFAESCRDYYFTEFSTKWRLKGIKSEYSLPFYDVDDLSSILLKQNRDTI